MVGKNILEHTEVSQFEFFTPSSKELNLQNYEAIYSYIRKYQPELIIHAAGLVGGIQANIQRPVDFLVQNTDIGRNIIMASKNAGVKQMLNLASSCIYPRNGENPLKEEQILTGELEPTNEGYAIAKIFAARLCEYISRENPDFAYKTIIPSNLYGRFDKFDPINSHMIPAVIRKIYTATIEGHEEVIIWGDGESRREFLYAADLADFIFYAIKHFDSMPQYLNVGLGHDYSINEYYRAVAEELKYKGSFTHDLSKPTGMRQKLINDVRLRDFGWSHKTSLSEGIRKTVEYYKNIIGND